MRDLMVAIAISVGAEAQQPFLSEYARRELRAHEMTQSVPKPSEIERGLEGAPNALGNVAPKGT